MYRWIILLTLIFNFAGAHEALEEGICLFNEKKYEQALITFQKTELTDKQPLASLIGQLFCNLALGRLNQIDPTIELIDQKIQEFINCDKPPKKGPLTPDQQLMTYQCRRHIREASNQMRQTVEKLVRETVTGIFQKIKLLRQLYPFIDALEQTGLDCCQNNFPLACCLDPILEQLEAWKSIGIPTGEVAK
jgi:hypothetical protein